MYTRKEERERMFSPAFLSRGSVFSGFFPTTSKHLSSILDHEYTTSTRNANNIKNEILVVNRYEWMG